MEIYIIIYQEAHQVIEVVHQEVDHLVAEDHQVEEEAQEDFKK